MPNGSSFVFENENAGAKPAEDQSQGTHVSRPSLRRSEDTVAQITDAVKGNDTPTAAGAIPSKEEMHQRTEGERQAQAMYADVKK